MVHVVLPVGGPPVGVVLPQLDIESVQTSGRLDVEGALADLLDSRDPGERQKETEMLGELGIVADDDVAALHILSVELSPVGRQEELRFGSGGLWTGLQGGQRSRGVALRGDLDVDVAPLEDPTDIGSIRSACAEPLDGCLLVSERFQEGEGKLARIEGLPGEGGDRLFNLYGIHRSF